MVAVAPKVTLKDDQLVIGRPEYRVCTGGEYKIYQLVNVYRIVDEKKTPEGALHAKFIETGEHLTSEEGELDDEDLAAQNG